MRRVGLYGGTFDPIHVGHLNLALEMIDRGGVDEVWFCPANISPDKMGATITEARHRLEMVRLAIEGVPGLSLTDCELKRPAPSYTIDTVQQLKAEHPDCAFRLILASDTAGDFPKWRESERLAALAPPLVGRRRCEDRLPIGYPASLREWMEEGWVETSVFEICSRSIRQWLREGRYCDHLLTAAVADYIRVHGLYR
jgi:nicotinate-nucleotide adenylyltransferase